MDRSHYGRDGGIPESLRTRQDLPARDLRKIVTAQELGRRDAFALGREPRGGGQPPDERRRVPARFAQRADRRVAVPLGETQAVLADDERQMEVAHGRQ
jgi:hypothetical protein